MSVQEVKDLVRIEVLTPPANGFIMGRNHVGDALTGTGVTLVWQDYTCDAQGVSITRGGAAEGVSTSLDVGTTTIEWVGELPESLLGQLQPNYPMRVRALDGDTDPLVFTGTVQDIRRRRDRHNAQLSYVSFTGVDAVQSHANTTRYGAITDGGIGFEPWTNRIVRLADSAQMPVDVPERSAGYQLKRYPRNSDADSSLTWYGSPPGARFKYLISGTQTPHGYRTFEFLYIEGPLAGRQGVYYHGTTGLTIGDTYRVRFVGTVWWVPFPSSSPTQELAIGVEDQGFVDGYTVFNNNVTGAPAFVLEREFVATKTDPYFVFTTGVDTDMGAGVQLSVQAYIEVVRVVKETPVQDVVYESSLASHFDLVTNSIRGVWWVDRENITHFSKSAGEGDSVAHFDKVHDTTDPLHVCFTEVEEELSTSAIVNNLTIAQHGRDAVTGNAKDTNHLFKSETSIATWGAQAQTLDTCLYDGGAWAGAVAVLAMDTLQANDTPTELVSSVQFNVREHTWVLADLEVYARVTVYGTDYVVVGIDHDIKAEEWLCTLTLRKADN